MAASFIIGVATWRCAFPLHPRSGCFKGEVLDGVVVKWFNSSYQNVDTISCGCALLPPLQSAELFTFDMNDQPPFDRDDNDFIVSDVDFSFDSMPPLVHVSEEPLLTPVIRAIFELAWSELQHFVLLLCTRAPSRINWMQPVECHLTHLQVQGNKRVEG